MTRSFKFPLSLILTALLSSTAFAKSHHAKIDAGQHSAAHGKAAHHKSHGAAGAKPDPAAPSMARFSDYARFPQAEVFVDEMVNQHGFTRQEVEVAIADARHIPLAVQLVKPMPAGKPKNWSVYRSRFVDPVRIQAGAAFWSKYATDLARAESQYGVPAEIIVGILGVETIYGRQAGTFRVMDVVSTLAFDYPETRNQKERQEYFRGELAETLVLAREAKMSPFSLIGSFAGAVGWPQFMPSSIRKYAVDFDGDGRVNLTTSPVDAIGSIANFLVAHGWKPGGPLVFRASVNPAREADWSRYINQGLEAKYQVGELAEAGVHAVGEIPGGTMVSLVDLQDGEQPTKYWLGAGNFFAITQYNRSYFYAMSVIDLGQAIKATMPAK